MFVYLLPNIIKRIGNLHGQVICLVILVRTILEAIIAFFPVKEDHSAIGAIDYPIEIRKKLAVASQKWSCEKCG
jgi:hypothetical protein